MKVIAICLLFLLIFYNSALGAINLILQDSLEGTTMGRPSGISYVAGQGGKGALFNSPSDCIEYAAEEFGRRAGRIELDLSFTQSIDSEHEAWCLLSDVGDKTESPGSIILRWPKNSGVLEYGVSDGKTYHWCRSRRGDWQKDRWYHLTLTYGHEGMSLEVDRRVEGTNTYRGSISELPVKFGFHDDVYDAPPVVVDNIRTYQSNAAYMSVQPKVITIKEDGTSPVCSIDYGVAETGVITIELVNAKNKVVRAIIEDRIQEAGEYSINWSPQGIKEGEYTVRLISQSTSQAQGQNEKITIEKLRPIKADKPPVAK